jgi:hypothetical protein
MVGISLGGRGLVLLCALPLLWPDIPPLVDLPGHMGRYRVQLDLANSPELQAFTPSTGRSSAIWAST